MQKKAATINSLKKIEKQSLPELIERSLMDFLIDNKLQPGDPIPKETELAKSLNVSRTAIREALVRLKMTGLIHSKKKQGMVLANPDLFALFEKSSNPRILTDKTLQDIFELRLVLEIGMGDLIFARKKPEHIKELREIVARQKASIDETTFNIDDEVTFHGKLYEITNNDTLKRFQHLLLPLFQYVHDSGILKKKVKPRQYVSHKGLVDILEKGTAEEFRNAMKKHLENHFQRLDIK